MTDHYETRSQVLIRYLQDWQRRTRTSWPTIATSMRETYHAMVQQDHRAVLFETQG